MNKFGMHGPNKDPTDIATMLSMGMDCYTVVDKWEQVEQIRAARPDALILIRPFFMGGMAIDPVIATQCAYQHAEEFMYQTRHLVVGNELNIESPSFDSYNPDSWKWMNEWVCKSVEAVRRYLPEAIIHFPAISPGVGDDPNILDPPGLVYCREAVDACDILDQHIYWPPRHPERFEPWFGRRMLWHHKLFPDKYIFISECGPTDVRPPGTAQDVVNWFRILEREFPYVLGGTLFMWNWGENQDHFNYYDKPWLVNALRDAPKLEFELPRTWVYDDYTPEPDGMTFREELKNDYWNTLPWGKIPFNPEYAFPVAAEEEGLGAPLSGEIHEVRQGKNITKQHFALGLLWCEDENWDDIHVVR